MTTIVNKEDGFTVTFQDDAATKAAAFEVLRKWFLRYQLFHGDSINQTDTTYVEAPALLTELAEDVFKFETVYE